MNKIDKLLVKHYDKILLYVTMYGHNLILNDSMDTTCIVRNNSNFESSNLIDFGTWFIVVNTVDFTDELLITEYFDSVIISEQIKNGYTYNVRSNMRIFEHNIKTIKRIKCVANILS